MKFLITLLLLQASSLPLSRSFPSHQDKIQQLAPKTRRKLLSSFPNGNLNKDSTYKLQRDWANAPPYVSLPELYYQDLEDGSRQFIWTFDDTRARDVLAGRPEIWLYTLIDAERDEDAVLITHLLEHYSRAGQFWFSFLLFSLHYSIDAQFFG